MLPLIFSAGDGKKGIFMPFHLGIGIRSLYYFKKIGESGAALKVRYCIECKSENYVKKYGESRNVGRQEAASLPAFWWRALEQSVCKTSLI